MKLYIKHYTLYVVLRLRIPGEAPITHFTDPCKKFCTFDEYEIEFSMLLYSLFIACQFYGKRNVIFVFFLVCERVFVLIFLVGFRNFQYLI